jgi:hypothetical protein
MIHCFFNFDFLNVFLKMVAHVSAVLGCNQTLCKNFSDGIGNTLRISDWPAALPEGFYVITLQNFEELVLEFTK